MKKLMTLALIGVALASPAFADDAAEQARAVAQDKAAIAKDDAAIAKNRAILERNRASKAQNKAEGDTVGQAVDSVKIGVNHAVIGGKKLEKNIDQKIKEKDEER